MRRLLALLVVALAVPAAASAHATWKHEPGTLAAPLLHHLVFLRGEIVAARDDRCREQPRPRDVLAIAPWNRDLFIARWRASLPRVEARASRCLPTTVVGIIRYVFPDSTEDAAIRVASCETGGTFWPGARNPSGASGVFQLMPGHWLDRFDPFDAWANIRYALRLSDGGTNWGPWVCKP